MVTVGYVYHFGHVFSDRLGSLHRVDGDRAGLLHAELTFETLLKFLLSEVQFGVLMVFPLKKTYKRYTVCVIAGSCWYMTWR